MKLNYTHLKSKSSLIKSATGLNLKEFDYLCPCFSKHWEHYINRFTFEGKERQRVRKVRKNSTFKTAEDMLIFILYDYRHNPTQDFMGLHFNLPQPKVAMWLKVLEPILLESLKDKGLVPQRDSNSLDTVLFDSVTLLLDGTERPINKPKYEEEDYYSGKKRGIR